MNTTTDTYAILDTIRVTRRSGSDFAGIPVHERKSFVALEDASVRTMVFEDVDQAIDYVTTMTGSDASVMHNRKCSRFSDGVVYQFRVVRGVPAGTPVPCKLSQKVDNLGDAHTVVAR